MKIQKAIFILVCTIAIGTGIFYSFQPMYEAKQQTVRKEVLVDYLAKTYPTEKYTLTLAGSNPFRNSYRYNVVFKSESNIQFEYIVGSNNEVGQSSYMILSGEKRIAIHNK